MIDISTSSKSNFKYLTNPADKTSNLEIRVTDI